MLTDANNVILACLPALRAFAMALTADRDQADDLVLAALRNLRSGAEQLPDGSNLRNRAFASVRQTYRAKAPRLAHRDSHVCAAWIERPLSGNAMVMNELMSCLARLPIAEREVVALVVAQKFTIADTAEVLACSLQVVRSQLSRGKRAMRKMLLGPAQPKQRVLVMRPAPAHAGA